MELLQLRYFLTVAKTLNISKAAQHHMIPQPAMSQTISRLEKELGKPLFDRHKNKLSLTKEGESFLHSVTASLSELDTAIQDINCESETLQGELSLLVQQHRTTLIDCIVEFRKIYPQVSFRVFHMQDPNEINDYDLCISRTPLSKKYNESKGLITEKIKLMVSTDHPIANKDCVRFEELKNEDFALLNMNNSLWRHTMHLCNEAGFEPKISMVSDDIYCMTKYVSTGLAVTMAPELAWRNIKNDKITFVPTLPEETRTTYVFWDGQKKSSKLKTTFLDFLVDYFASLEI